MAKECPACPAGKICNPATGRCVLVTGAIGKKISGKPNVKPNVKPKTRLASARCSTHADCDATRVCNPLTGRCVLRTGPAGRRILSGGVAKKKINRGPPRTVIVRSNTRALTDWVSQYMTRIASGRRHALPVQTRVFNDTPPPWVAVYYWYTSSNSEMNPENRQSLQHDIDYMMSSFERDRLAGKAPGVVVTSDVLLKIARDIAIKKIGARKWQEIVNARGRVDLKAPKHQVASSSYAKQARRLERAGSPDPESKKALKCADLVTVPQSPSRGTCWFNAILMVFLFSDRMRYESKRVLSDYASTVKNLAKSQKNERVRGVLLRNDILQRIASLLLIYKQPRKAQNVIYNKAFKHGIRPEDILRSIHALDPTAFRSKINPYSRVANVARGVSGYYPNEAVPFMLQLFGIDAAMYKVDSFRKGGTFRQGTLHLTEVWSNSSSPNIRTVIIGRGAATNRHFSVMQSSGSQGWKMGAQYLVAASSSMPDTIVMNNKTYVLDASMFSSWPEQGAGHVIAGISCNNSKMYYNGWSSADKSRPCPLIDVDWTKRGIFLASSHETETLQSDYCHMTARKSPDDFAFDGTSVTQDQLMFYVLKD